MLPIVARSLLPVLRAERGSRSQLAGDRRRGSSAARAARSAAARSGAGRRGPRAVAAPDARRPIPGIRRAPVVVAYGPGVEAPVTSVAIAALDGWTDSVPSRRHATFAAFGFNAPKSRAPQAVLVAVPPDISQRLDNAGLLDVVLETRELAHARAPRQTGGADAAASDVHGVRQRGGAAQLPRRVAGMSDPLYLILEPGRTDTDEGLRARVADPVWFITRQWQLGELQGEDASTPGRRHVRAAARADHLRPLAAGSRSDRHPRRSAARGGARRLVDHRPARPAGPRRRAAARRRGARSLSPRHAARAVRDSSRTTSTGARSSSPACSPAMRSGRRCRRPRPTAGRRPSSTTARRSRLAAPACAHAITPAATSTGSPSTAIRSRCRSRGRRRPREPRESFPGGSTIPARRIRAGGSSRIAPSTSAASRPIDRTSRRCCCSMSRSSTPTTGSRSRCRRRRSRTRRRRAACSSPSKASRSATASARSGI